MKKFQNKYLNEFAEEMTQFSERGLKKVQDKVRDTLSKVRDKDKSSK